MIKLGLLLVALTSCNRWVRPTPPAPETREAHIQQLRAVKVSMQCGNLIHHGSGVVVSDWQVLTAFHIVDCQSSLATIRVTDHTGEVFRFAPEKEWPSIDISRIQMATADSFDGKITPPTIRGRTMPMYEPVYIQTAMPKREEIIGEATGYSYGGSGYGSGGYRTFSYIAPTQSGNSGSGVYDIDGRLVGIHSKRSAETGLGYASLIVEEMIPR